MIRRIPNSACGGREAEREADVAAFDRSINRLIDRFSTFGGQNSFKRDETSLFFPHSTLNGGGAARLPPRPRRGGDAMCGVDR